MTIVTKKIKGNKYYYFQDAIKLNNGKFKNISTCIGRVDLNSKDLDIARTKAATKQFIKTYKATSLIKKTTYHFRNKPSHTIYNSDYFEFVKLTYHQLKANSLPDEMHEIERTVFVKYVHGTTAIEGNTLTEEETEKVLFKDQTPLNKSRQEYLEVANYNDVQEFLDNYNDDVNEKMILTINFHLMKNLYDKYGKPIRAGEYRSKPAIIKGVWYTPPSPEMVEQRMHYLLAEYNDGIKKNIHPIELISIFHQKFEEIHPFQDGNGRTGRAILNYMLQWHGFPPIYIPKELRRRYLDALEKGNNSNFIPLIDLIISRIDAMIWLLYTYYKEYDAFTSPEYENMIKSLSDESYYNKIRNRLQHLKKSQIEP
ncbi:MAG TPA: Fic family protein [Nitrososphaeraceae archaeon]|jgi:fido (protein-threonine AMPylation protein)|nr:Fic family protein [Nitrososphaeraceae archaeon]